MDEDPINNIPTAMQAFRQRVFYSWKLILIVMGLSLFSIVGAFFAGRESSKLDRNTLLTPTVAIIKPTDAITRVPTLTCPTAPPCSDVIPINCTRGEPVFDANGCLKSCGQLQCESLQQAPTAVSCNTDNDCPKSASCVGGDDGCWLYLCKNRQCVLTSVPQ
jgi:hypothetical protein